MSERWLPIPGYEGLYEASEQGRIRNARNGFVLKPYIRGRYLSVTLHKNGARRTPEVHTLILRTFRGPPPAEHVGAHRDGEGTNNKLENLRWATSKENEADKLLHGKDNRGIKCRSAKFTALQVQIIREAHAAGLSVDKIGILVGVHGSTIYNIVRRDSYADVAAVAPTDKSPVGEADAPDRTPSNTVATPLDPASTPADPRSASGAPNKEP